MDCDVVVVGGSYSGLAAVLQLARARRRVVVVDAGRRRNRMAVAAHGFPTRDGEDPATIRSIALGELMGYSGFEFVQGEVVSAGPVGDGFEAVVADGHRWTCRKIVLATGVADELPAIAGLEDRWGRSVVPCPYCHGYESADRPLGVVNMREASAHQAMLMPDWGPTTFFLQQGPEPDPETLARLAARGVAIERSPVVGLLGPSPQLEAVRLADGRAVALSLAFLTPVTSMPGPLVRGLGCAIDEGPTGPLVRTGTNQETTVHGVFAAGDATLAVPSIAVAVSTGVVAGVAAHHALVHDLANPTEVAGADPGGAAPVVVDGADLRAS